MVYIIQHIKKILLDEGKIDEDEDISIEATWGVQNDVKDNDWIVVTEGDMYKVEAESNGNPEKYILLKEKENSENNQEK